MVNIRLGRPSVVATRATQKLGQCYSLVYNAFIGLLSTLGIRQDSTNTTGRGICI
jgi:hypothetical protein